MKPLKVLKSSVSAIDLVGVAWFDVGDHTAGVMTLPIKVASRSEEDGKYWRCGKCKLSQVVLCLIMEMIACQAVAILGNMC